MNKEKKWYQKISNWLLLIACLILIPILVINLYIMYQANNNKDEIPSVFGYKPFIVLSGSMETKIHQGDLIITKIVKPETLKENDDNNDTQDQNLVAYEDVEGIYITRFPTLGSMMNSLSEPTTIIIILLGVTIIFIIGFSISNRKQRELMKQEYLEYKRMKEEQEKKEKENSSKKNKTKKS